MIGCPKFTFGDEVEFDMYIPDPKNKTQEKLVSFIGIISIVDKYGIFVDNTQVYYDIYVEGMGLFKHIAEKGVRAHTCSK